MNILKRDLAPISAEAWEEIDETAVDVLKSILSARLVLKVDGPKGWEYSAVPHGRLKKLSEEENDVQVASLGVLPLVEARVRFVLNKWELDNIERGAKDIDLAPLEEAVEELALFEENLIYNGYSEGNMVGLSEAAGVQKEFGAEPNDILESIGEARYALFESYVRPPYDLVVSAEAYKRLNVIYEGANFMKQVERLIEGKIIRSKAVKGAILLPSRDEDLELTVGQDFSIGYESHDTKTVTLFVTETLAFRVLDEDKVVNFTL